MTISLNGEKVDASRAPQNRSRELSRLRYQLPPSTHLVEHNGVAVHRREWNENLSPKATVIELIRVVAGG